MKKNNAPPLSYIDYAKELIREESDGLILLAKELRDDFSKVVKLVINCSGNIIITGIGKSGLIGQKIASTISSTGIPAFFIHPSEANHGDMGKLSKNDLVIILSKSGESKEFFNIIEYCHQLGITMVAITAKIKSVWASGK